MTIFKGMKRNNTTKNVKIEGKILVAYHSLLRITRNLFRTAINFRMTTFCCFGMSMIVIMQAEKNY